jgi:copper oxidase (laccase) domain-containing protein
MHFCLGPSIGNCCYEVGDEVAALFEDHVISKRNDRFFVDLPKALKNKLISLGVRESNVGESPGCTSCLPDKYYSYRRDGKAPIQMVSFILKS